MGRGSITNVLEQLSAVLCEVGFESWHASL